MFVRSGRAAAITAVFCLLFSPSADADVVELDAIQDNTLYEPIQKDNLEDRSNGAGNSMFAGRVRDAQNASGQVAVRRAVLKFDIAGNVPAGATIDSVQLTLNATKVKRNNAYDTGLHRLVSDWGEGASNTGNSQQGRGEAPATGDATWNHTFYSGQFWTTPGGDYEPLPSATVAVGGTGAWTWGSTPEMVADVQAWLDTPTQNFGWILIGDETQIETAKVYATRENTGSGGALVPKLSVTFTPLTTQGACCQGETCTTETETDCGTLGGVYQGDGTTCSPNPCVEPFGACCASDGTCTEQTETDCLASGGAFSGDGSTCATVECPIELTKYVDPLPIPPAASPTSGQSGGAARYDLSMVEFQHTMHSELPPTTVWGFDDGLNGPLYPGPTIEARTGAQVEVNWVNDLRELSTGLPRTEHYLDVDTACVHGAADEAKTVVHLHGGHVPAEFDGYPEATFLPGNAELYTYPNGQDAGTLWYHDHSLGITRLNVYMGLAGAYLIRDDVEDALNLPAAPYELPLVIQDRKFNPDGTLQYPSVWQDHFFGDKILVNGKVWPFLEVDQGKYRFRVLNGSGSRTYTLELAPPAGTLDFTVIGTEGGLLDAPVPGVSQLTIGPGERYDVVVDFETFGPGDEILLTNSAPAPFPNGSVDLTEVMKFTVANAAGDTDPLPTTLRTVERIPESEAIMTRDFELKKADDDGCGRSNWLINGLVWDDITEYPELGTTEIWRFINDSGVSHPMHMHLVFFQVLDRDGFTRDANGNIVPDGTPVPPSPEEDGWKDTAMVAPNEILRVIARFESYKGKYAYHCHILEHEDHEMMRQFQTVSCGDGETDLPVEECDDASAGGNGCNAECEVEEFTSFAGVADGGGQVSMTIEGEVVTIDTVAGQTADEVAQAMADAINANATLQSLGVTASADGSRVVTNGDITDVTVTDPGLTSELELTVQPTRIWWGSIGASGGYDLVRGDLDALRSTAGDFSDPLVTTGCLTNDDPATFFEESATPIAGSGWWYAVRAQPGGTYDSGGAGQSGARDSGIGASGNGCP